jgi:pilus assembly protein FimV
MGRELDPGNALFAAGAAAAAALSAEDKLDDMGLGLDAGLSDDATISKLEGIGDEPSSLDLSDMQSEAPNILDSENLDVELALDSEFIHGLDQDGEATIPPMEAPQEAGESQDENIDLSSGLSLEEELLETDTEPSTFNELDDAESLDLESLEKELESLSGDLDNASAASSIEEFPDEETNEYDLGMEGTDEIGTKLDLARAYVDMGDVEGAKGILEEVVEEGSEEQKAEARDLLGSLPG